ncbi:MAG: MoaD/ThiS family protein [Chloroflexi bacterium]|nr:MoaD/ThiS family protein [Chloroflexota bacterium]
MATVFIPSQWRDLTAGQAHLDLPGASVGAVLQALVAAYPAIGERLFDDGRIRPGLAVAVDGEMGSHALRHALRPNSELSIIPMIAGG